MISPEYARTMARYNAWQNNQLIRIIDVMDQVDFDLDRGAFFGSIQGTLSHLLWGDMMWMSRFDAQSVAPTIAPADSAKMCLSKSEWSAERVHCDERIRTWAAALSEAKLSGDLTWFSGLSGRELSQPLASCVVHLFNHQTHHRGQVHAMITAAGHEAPVSDIPFMPDDG